MELHQKLELIFDVDAVLRGQGADPAILRARRPGLVAVAERAMQESHSFLHPKVVYKEFNVAGVKHERLMLDGGQYIQNRLIAQHLAPASQVIVMLATIGEGLEERVSKAWDSDMVYALALDGAGSAAVEALANAACRYFEKEAAQAGMQASIPFSPGMVEWSVAEGQPQVFNLLGDLETGVHLTPSFIMVPQKSLTMIMGIGADVSSSGRTCDYCAMSGTCKYQSHYLPEN